MLARQVTHVSAGSGCCPNTGRRANKSSREARFPCLPNSQRAADGPTIERSNKLPGRPGHAIHPGPRQGAAARYRLGIMEAGAGGGNCAGVVAVAAVSAAVTLATVRLYHGLESDFRRKIQLQLQHRHSTCSSIVN